MNMDKKRMTRRDRGAGLIIMIIVVAFLLSVGILLLFVTGTGSAVATNVRQQERAFSAAEAGFDATFESLNTGIVISKSVTDFSTMYRTTFGGQPGLDDPASPNYFRRRTDDELWADVVSDPTNAVFVNQPLSTDSSLTYTVFLVNDEAVAGVTANDMDCLVICLGRAGRNTYARIEVTIEIHQ
jgi:hypothetical protein